MLNKKSIKAITQQELPNGFVQPNYDSYCFSNIPGTIKHLFGLKATRQLPRDVTEHLKESSYEKIIFLFLDAFGWRFFEKYKDSIQSIDRIEKKALVSKLTSQFPSTTTAHVTTMNTGLNLGEHGLYEWNVYEKQLDTIICPLLFSYSGDKTRETLKNSINPNSMLPAKSFYKDLKNMGIKSYIFQNNLYNKSSMSKRYFKDVEDLIGFDNNDDCFKKLSKKFNSTKGKNYFFVYVDTIDYISHRSGPTSIELGHEIKNVFDSLENNFLENSSEEKALLLISADHGQVEVFPDREIFINKMIPEIENYVRKDKKGKQLGPAGSSRDLFLHIHAKKIKEAKNLLSVQLKGIAKVFETKGLIEQGFFGNVTKYLESRIGDIVIAPYKGYTVWWYDEKIERPEFLGHHGGLTKEEIEIPFIALEF